MHWKAMEFKNIQSWENGRIEFNQKGLTVIEAKSETGKSVFIKCLRLGLYFEQYNSKTRTAIIRNYPTNKQGDFKIELEDGTLVIFRFFETRVNTAVQYPDKTIKAISRENINDIAELLNLITCKNSYRILNILDNETPMLYDTTDMEYNTNIMSMYLDHSDLRNRKTLCETFIKRLKSKADNLKFLLESYSEKLARVNISYDITKAEEDINTCIKLDEKLKILEQIKNELSRLNSIKFKEELNLASFENVLENINLISNIIEYLQYINKSLTKRTTINLQSLQTELNQLLERKNIIKNFKYLTTILYNTEKTAAALNESKRKLAQFKEKYKTCPLCGQVWR